MMDRKYWEKVAGKQYGQLIFDVLGNDSNGEIVKAIQQIASPQKTVVDVGCAVGRWLPLLASSFKKVHAVDISSKYIDTAKENNRQFKNIEYLRADFFKVKKEVPVCDAAICINMILTPNANARHACFTNLSKTVKLNGHLILVVPSLESAVFSQFIFNHWNSKSGKFDPTRKENSATGKNVFDGLIELDGTFTKHYLQTELQFVLKTYGFQMLQATKVEYNWDTEFTEPPNWLTTPRPWDWLVVAKRK